MGVYSEGSHKIVLMQAYHVTAEHDLTLQLSGSWVLHSAHHLFRVKDENPTNFLRDTENKNTRLKTGEGVLDLPNIDWDTFKEELKPGESVLSMDVKFGRVEELQGDPLLRRDDLTGVHLRCSTIQVGQSFQGVVCFHSVVSHPRLVPKSLLVDNICFP